MLESQASLGTVEGWEGGCAMHAENAVTIERPIEEVFEYVSTPEKDPTWVSASVRHERTSAGPMRVGTTTEEDVKFLGRTAMYTWEVTEYNPPTVIAYRAASGLLPGTAIRLRLEPVEGGTKLTHAVDLEPSGIYYRALAPLMPWVGRRFLDSLDRTLKNLLEGTTTTPEPRSETASGTITAGVVAATIVAVIVLLLLGRRSRSSRRYLGQLTSENFPARHFGE
jgi:uncharacterized protein YndB with AHSA1/START domain